MTHFSKDSPEVEALNKKLMQFVYGGDGPRDSGNKAKPNGDGDLEILSDDEKIITNKKNE